MFYLVIIFISNDNNIHDHYKYIHGLIHLQNSQYLCLYQFKPLLVLPTHLLLQNVNEKLAFELNKTNLVSNESSCRDVSIPLHQFMAPRTILQRRMISFIPLPEQYAIMHEAGFLRGH